MALAYASRLGAFYSFLNRMAKANETSPAEHQYVLSPQSDINGTHLFARVQLSPAAVVQRFGHGQEGDGYKISREWIFRRHDLLFTLYDWKSTNLYDSDSWSAEQLWASSAPFDLHVGSKDPATQEDVEAFIAYLQRETNANEKAPALAVFASPGDQLYVAETTPGGAQIRHVAVLTLNDSPKENEAYADLFAASRELLDASKELLDSLNAIGRFTEDERFHAACDATYQAIDNAEGQAA